MITGAAALAVQGVPLQVRHLDLALGSEPVEVEGGGHAPAALYASTTRRTATTLCRATRPRRR